MAPSVSEDGTPGAIPLADKIAATYGFDLSHDSDAILANPAMRKALARYAVEQDLRVSGNTRLAETRKAKDADGNEIDEDVFDVPRPARGPAEAGSGPGEAEGRAADTRSSRTKWRRSPRRARSHGTKSTKPATAGTSPRTPGRSRRREAVGQKFVPSRRYRGLDGKWHDTRRGRPVAVEAAAARGTVLFGAPFRDTEERTPGGLLIGSLDVFASGEPVAFLRNLAAHFHDPARNRLVVIPGAGHTYQSKARETALEVANFVRDLDRG